MMLLKHRRPRKAREGHELKDLPQGNATRAASDRAIKEAMTRAKKLGRLKDPRAIRKEAVRWADAILRALDMEA